MDIDYKQSTDTSWIGAEFRNQLLTIKVPLHWRVSYEEGIVSIADPNDYAALVISHWRLTTLDADLLATDHLDAFLEENQINSSQILERSSTYAVAHYHGLEQSDWYVAFCRSEMRIFLITLNVRQGLSECERAASLASFASIELAPER